MAVAVWPREGATWSVLGGFPCLRPRTDASRLPVLGASELPRPAAAGRPPGAAKNEPRLSRILSCFRRLILGYPWYNFRSKTYPKTWFFFQGYPWYNFRSKTYPKIWFFFQGYPKYNFYAQTYPNFCKDKLGYPGLSQGPGISRDIPTYSDLYHGCSFPDEEASYRQQTFRSSTVAAHNSLSIFNIFYAASMPVPGRAIA